MGYKIIRAGIPVFIHVQYEKDVFPVLEQFLKVRAASQFLSSFHNESVYPRSRNKRPGTYALLLVKVVGTNVWMLYLSPVVRASRIQVERCRSLQRRLAKAGGHKPSQR